MNCDQARTQLSLYIYGELSFDQEEALELHLDHCVECRDELALQRELHHALDEAAFEPQPSELWDARERLRTALAAEPRKRRWSLARFLGWDTPQGRLVWQGLGAVALVAVSFTVGRTTVDVPRMVGNATRGSLAEPVASRVRYIEPTGNGQVQIVLDETRQRVLTGNLDEDRIRGLLLAAAKDPADPGLRVESVQLLQSRPGSDVRDALIYALKNDPNDGVRLKALSGLKAFAGDTEMRRELVQVLLSDQNPGIRTQAIDLLMSGSDRVALEKQLAGVLQQLLVKENNTYVRQRCERALEDMRASAETY